MLLDTNGGRRAPLEKSILPHLASDVSSAEVEKPVFHKRQPGFSFLNDKGWYRDSRKNILDIVRNSLGKALRDFLSSACGLMTPAVFQSDSL